MSVSDVMGGAGLSLLPQVALLVFLGAFVALVWRAVRRSDASATDAAARLPLDDQPSAQ